MTEISAPLMTLLTECQSSQHMPPFDSLIDSTLSSLSSSRFNFAVEVEQALSSQGHQGDSGGNGNGNIHAAVKNEANLDLNDQQRLCLTHALRKIGNGFTTTTTTTTTTTNNRASTVTHEASGRLGDYGDNNDETSHEENAFRGLLERYATEYGYDDRNVDIMGTGSGGGSGSGSESATATISASGQPPHTSASQTLNYSTLFQPSFYRPPPFTLSSQSPMTTDTDTDQSLHFLHTSYPTLRYQWLIPLEDKSKDDSETSSVVHNELLQKAFHTPLEMEEERLVVSILQQHDGIKASPTKHNKIGSANSSIGNNRNSGAMDPLLSFLTPENLPQLVHHNPTIAIEFLLKLHPKPDSSTSTSSHESEALYHSALVNMDITLHTMEVVYKLATNHILHPEYLHIFVLGLFERCKSPLPVHVHSSGYDYSTGQRFGTEGGSGSGNSSVGLGMGVGGGGGGGGGDRKMIRLVSVFLQNLIQNEIVQVEDFVEVQAFCIENSRVREANSLFKLLKEKRVNGNGGSGSGSSSVGGFNIGTNGENSIGGSGPSSRIKYSGRGGNVQRKNKKSGVRKK